MPAWPAENFTPEEDEWTRRLAPYTERVLLLRCTCGAKLEELQVALWTLLPYPAGPHPGSQRRGQWPGVQKRISWGLAPGFLGDRIQYAHTTVRGSKCRAKHRAFTGAQLAAAFIAQAERTDARYIELRMPGPNSWRPRDQRARALTR